MANNSAMLGNIWGRMESRMAKQESTEESWVNRKVMLGNMKVMLESKKVMWVNKMEKLVSNQVKKANN